jgi:hypothetical protein
MNRFPWGNRVTNEEGEEMSKTRRLLILIVVLVVALGLMATAGTAAAGKPDCDENPDHPSCKEDPSDETPTGGTMCDPADYPDGIDGVQTGDFSLTLDGDSTYACIDVLAAAGPWEVTVTVTGSRARSLLLVGRDSVAPGDACDVLDLRRDDIHAGGTLVMPAATINACGVEWAEWVSIETPGLDPDPYPDGHCVDFDDAGRCLVADMVDVTHPLVFQANMSGFRDATATIHVDLP